MSLQGKIDQAYLRLASAKSRKARRQALLEMEALLAERAADPDTVVRMEHEIGLSAHAAHNPEAPAPGSTSARHRFKHPTDRRSS